MKYDMIYYYLDNDIIMTSDKSNGTYKERFKIKSIGENQMTLYDYKTKKEYIFTIRG